MKKSNQRIIGAIVGLGLGLSMATAASAYTPFVYDAYRTGEFAVQGIQRMLSLVAEYQKVHSKQEELKTWEKRKKQKKDKTGEDDGTGDGDGADGSGESGGSEGGSSGSSGGSSGGSGKDSDKPDKLPEKSQFYDYVSGADTDSMGSEQYLPAGSSEDYIRKYFFYDPDLEKVTEEEINKITQKRYAYLEALAKEILSLSAGIREQIAAELTVIKKSKTTAGGDVNQVEFLAQTKKVMVEQKAADLILQTKLMELEAAEMLLGLSPQRIEDPSKKAKK